MRADGDAPPGCPNNGLTKGGIAVLKLQFVEFGASNLPDENDFDLSCQLYGCLMRNRATRTRCGETRDVIGQLGCREIGATHVIVIGPSERA